jgi:hypothetical protein
MTHEIAYIINLRMLLMFAMFGLIMFASNAPSRKASERIKTKQRKAAGGKSGRRRAEKLQTVKRGKKVNTHKTKAKKAPAAKKWFVAPKLSDADQIEYDMYHAKRQFV